MLQEGIKSGFEIYIPLSAMLNIRIKASVKCQPLSRVEIGESNGDVDYLPPAVGFKRFSLAPRQKWRVRKAKSRWPQANTKS